MMSNKYNKYLEKFAFPLIKDNYLVTGRQRKNRENQVLLHLVHEDFLLYTGTPTKNESMNSLKKKSLLSHFSFPSHLTVVIWGGKQTNLLCSHGSFISTSFSWRTSITSPSSGWGIFIYMHRESIIYTSIRQIYDVETQTVKQHARMMDRALPGSDWISDVLLTSRNKG